MEFLITNWQGILAVIGPIAAWFGSRALKESELKKVKVETEGAELQTISANFKVYQDLINDLEIRFKTRIEELEVDLDKMKILNTELRKAVSNQERYIKKLTNKIEEYEKLEG